MATDKLNINGWDDGWPTGYVSNVDEPVASADGQTVSTTAFFDSATFDLSASVINDIDVITDVGITIRASHWDKFGGDGTLIVSLLVGGVGQGSETTAVLEPFGDNYVLSNAGWDSDWTAAQLAGMQVRVQADSTGPDEPEWRIDCIDVDITYTEVAPITRTPDEGTLALAGEIPFAITVEEKPAAALPVLLGIAPTLVNSTVPAAGSATLAGQLSYVNPVTVQLQPNIWDSGWPTGYVSNVDEPVASADGQVVSTGIPGDDAVFGLDNVPATLTNEDTVLGVTIQVRAKFRSPTGGNTALDAGVFVRLVIDGTPLSGQYIDYLGREGVFVNETVSHSSWNDDWTVAQLNSMQVRVEADGFTTGDFFILDIDAIDVYVKHSAQSPLSVAPPVGSLALSGAAPTVRRLKYEQPLVGALALAGKIPELKRIDIQLPSPELLLLTGQVPAGINNYIIAPGIDALVLAGTPLRVVNDFYSPAVGTAALAGKIPTLGYNRFARPAERALVLEFEAPLLPQDGDDLLGPARARPQLVGKEPELVKSNSLVPKPTVGALALAGYGAIVTKRNWWRVLPAGALSLASAAPTVRHGTAYSTPVGTLTLFAPTDVLPVSAAQLVLAGPAPSRIVSANISVAAATLALTGVVPISRNGAAYVLQEELSLVGYAPALDFTSLLHRSNPRLISLSVDRDIEFIATPSDILIE